MIRPCLKKGKLIKLILCALLLGILCPMVMWGQALGDVNNSGGIDIVDALLISQFYVGLNPPGFVSSVADVNCSGGIDIIDALVVAQFYVGLISEFPCEETPGPTPVVTPDPTQEPGGETLIQLNGSSITVDGSGATVNGSTVTITTASTYTISGTLNDGRIIVNTDDESLVIINLNGINITSTTTSPFTIINAPEGVEIVLTENTQNYITDASSYTFFDDTEKKEPNAALFAKDDMDIVGDGTLIVDGNFNDAIACKDDINIKDCTINVTAVDDGIRGKNSLEIKSGATITVNSGGDCLKSDDEEDGLIEIKKCTLDLTSTGADGMDAAIQVTVTHAESNVTITAGGGNKVKPDQNNSTKGIKGTNNVTIEDGIITIDSSDDAIHSNDTIAISGATLNLATGDDGIHANKTMTISGGTIDITQSYEGIESQYLTISGGEIHLTADDDGINTPGEGWGGGDSLLTINGGYSVVTITDVTIGGSTGGDGVDANGDMTMTGGTLIVHGNSNEIDCAIDVDQGTFLMNGGFVVAAGTSAMAQAPGGNNSAQNSLLYNFDGLSANTLINIQTTNGTSILTFMLTKNYRSLGFSSPDLTMGTSYNIYTGGSASGNVKDGLYDTSAIYTPGTLAETFTVNSTVTSIGWGGGWRDGDGS